MLKMGAGLQDLLPRLRHASHFKYTFTLPRFTLRWTCLVQQLRKGVVKVVEGVRHFGRSSVKLRGPLGSFGPGMGPLRHGIFYIYILFEF